MPIVPVRSLAVSLPALALLAACGTSAPEDGLGPAPSDTSVVAVSISPDSTVAAAGTSVTFGATGRDANGATRSVSLDWSASGGTISSNGVFSATASGTFRVVGKARGRSRPADTSIVVVPPPVTLVRLDVTPSSASLAAGAAAQFAVSGRYSDSTTSAVAVTWTATGGTVSASGLYTAGASAGTYRVIARQEGGTLADTATVTITAPPPTRTLAAVVVTPSSATLAAGATQAFTATGRLSDGADSAIAVTWSATGGTVTSGGVYTAGGAAGTYRVIATLQGGTLADTSVVTVSATAPSSAECATPGAGWIWCDDFEQNRLASYFEYDNAGGRFTRSAGVGRDGSTGMRAVFNTTNSGAGALHLAFGRTPQSYFRPVDAGTASYREIYWRVWVRHQDGWAGGGGDKLSRATIFASSSSWAQAMIAHVWSGGTSSSWDYLAIDPASGTDEGGTLRTTQYNDFVNLRWLGLVRGQTPLFSSAGVGRWYCVEAHVRLNDAGQANGLFEMWVNGQLDATRTGLNWVGSYSAYGINAVFVENFWNNRSPVQQERYLDNFVVSTQRIGC